MRAKYLLAAAAWAAVTATAATAAERVMLRNGFEMHCDHHSRVEARTRLFLTRDEGNYIEFSPEEIATVESLPEAPSQQLSGEPQASLQPRPARDGKLSAVDLRQMLGHAGEAHNLDVDLLASLVKAESGGNERAVSRAGARGLMQLMPATAAGLGVEDSFKAEQNVRGGTAYLDALLLRYNDNLALALAAYNAGPQAVDRYHGIPPFRETQAYVARVIHAFNRRVLAREAQARRRQPPVEALRTELR